MLFIENGSSLFMFLKAYCDESYKTGADNRPKIPLIAGFLAQKGYWEVFAEKWCAVLAENDVKECFHFSDFNAKSNHENRESPYFGWSDDKRTNYFYNLALATTYGLIPIGGACRNSTMSAIEAATDPVTVATTAFFSDISEAMSLHFPNFKGNNHECPLCIVYEDTSQIKWRKKLLEMHAKFKATDSRFGCLKFEKKGDVAHIGLQAADFFCGVYWQAEETRAKLGGPLEHQRIIDLILFKNAYPSGDARRKLPDDFKNEMFKKLAMLLIEDEKKKKAKWRAKGILKKIYYPELEFDFTGYKRKAMGI